MPSPRQWLWFVGLWAGGVGRHRDRRLRDQALAYVVRASRLTVRPPLSAGS